MRKIFILILIFGVIFSGCSGIGGSQNGFFDFSGFSSSGGNNNVPEVDNTGTGLDVNFNFDNEYIKSGRLIYTLSIKNSGSQLIKLRKETNLELKFGDYLNEPIITTESRDAFYNKIFSESDEISLYQDQNYEQSGVLVINEKMLNSKTNTNFLVNLNVNYEYTTEFITNLELTEEYDMFKISSGGSFQQAAPVQVNSLKLVPSYDVGKYILEVTINDKGDRGDVTDLNDEGVELDDFKINFGKDSLSCTVKDKKDSSKLLVKKGSNLVLECPVTITDTKDFTTQVTGSFEYVYKNLNQISVSIPTSSS